MFEVLTAVAGALPLLAVLAVATGWVRARRVASRDTTLPARLIVQVTTVGAPGAAREVLREVRALPCPVPAEYWVVTEPGHAPQDYPEADRVLVVPAAFTCDARAKGRALEWARLTREREGVAGPDVKLLLLDDDSVPSARYLDLAVRADADIAQGVVAPRRHYGRGLSHVDDMRPLHCLAVCSWAQSTGRPVHVHGEGLCLRAAAEHAVTWDAAGSTLAEDLAFGQRAADLGLHWAFLPALVSVTSPWSLRALFTQRRRWSWGTLLALRRMSWRSVVRVAGLYVVTLGALAVSATGLLDAVTADAPLPRPLLVGLGAWLALFALAGLVATRGRRPGQVLLAVLLAVPSALANGLLVVGAVAAGPPRRFVTIRKLRPNGLRRVGPRLVTGGATLLTLAPLILLSTTGERAGPPPEARRGLDAPGTVFSDVAGPPFSAVRVHRAVRRRTAARAPDLRRGISVLAYGNDPSFAFKSRRLLDRLVDLEVSHVSLTIPIFTTGRGADEVHRDPRRTPTAARVLSFGRLAQERGLTVGLNPLLDEEVLAAAGSWRGELRPRDRDAWFASYRSLLARYATLAQRGHFNALNVGTEFESLMTDGRWRRVLRSVRARYDGTVSYAMAGSRILDPRLGWLVRHVDVVGVNAWYEADVPDGAGTARVQAALAPWQRALRRFRRRLDAPVIFSEAGLPAQVGAQRHPTIVTPDGAADPGAQARRYVAVCTLARRAGIDGILWWATTLDPPARPGSDTGFDPLGRAAADRIGSCRAA